MNANWMILPYLLNSNALIPAYFYYWFNFCFILFCQGQFPYPLHTLGEAMPQCWLGISDVLVESSHSSSVHLATIPSLLITLVALMYITGMFTWDLVKHLFCIAMILLDTDYSQLTNRVISTVEINMTFQRPNSQCCLSRNHYLTARV